MHTVEHILNYFFYCTNLPIQAMDENYKLIYNVGLNDELEYFISNDILIKKIKFNEKNDEESVSFSTIKFKDNIIFLIVPISKFDKNKGLFIVGPLKDSIDIYKNINYLPDTCINYVCNLLRNISEDKFSNGRVNLKLNPYVKKAIEYSKKNFDSPISVDLICNELNINKRYFCKIFKSETGYTFTNYLNIFRVEKSKRLLRNHNMSLLDVAISVGFNSQNYYSSVFKKITNKTPLEYKQELKI